MKDQHQIAALNDQFRHGDASLGLWVTTTGIDSLSHDRKQDLMQAVRDYKDFTEDNDPYGEHDFGVVKWEGSEYFWEIICYDKGLQHLSPHPENPSLTTRVLTLMLAEEYYTTTVDGHPTQEQITLNRIRNAVLP